MGYWLKLHPIEIQKLAQLAGLWYYEKFDDPPRESFVDEENMKVTTIGNLHEHTYTFDQLYNGEGP